MCGISALVFDPKCYKVAGNLGVSCVEFHLGVNGFKSLGRPKQSPEASLCFGFILNRSYPGNPPLFTYTFPYIPNNFFFFFFFFFFFKYLFIIAILLTKIYNTLHYLHYSHYLQHSTISGFLSLLHPRYEKKKKGKGRNYLLYLYLRYFKTLHKKSLNLLT